MPANRRKFCWCGGRDGCGHVVGELTYRDFQEGGRVTMLAVYESATVSPPDEMPELRGTIASGYGMHCTLCENEWDWYFSRASLDKLLLNYQVRNG